MTSLKEALLRQRRQERPSWRPGRFARVSALVEVYRLGEDFVAHLAEMQEREPTAAELALAAEKRSRPRVIFGLVGEEQFRVTERILALADNPYLEAAATPGEILLSGPLYRRQPGISADVLAATPWAAWWGEGVSAEQ